MSDNQDLLWRYITRDKVLSIDEFKELARAAKEQGRLDTLYKHTNEKIEFHRFARDNFTLNGHLEAAEDQEEELM